MATFLFVVPPFFGHISPTLSVGVSLLAQGHRVYWTGVTPLDGSYIPPGGQYILPEESLAKHQPAINHILSLQDEGPKLSAFEVLKLALEETYIPFARIMFEGVCRVIDQVKPDVVVNDCIAFAGGLAAHSKRVPYATTFPVPPDVMSTNMPKITAWQRDQVISLQHSLGIGGEEAYIHSRELNIAFTSQQFAACEHRPENLHFVGPVNGRPNEVAFDWERLQASSTPKVYVSLGTLLVDIRKAFFEKVVEAFADKPLTIIAATDPAILDRWPDNFIVQSYVPQTELMKRVDAVICHGGFNTVNDTFSNGLPMVITPITYDHFHIASLIEKAGCGIVVRYKRMRTAELASAVHEVLTNPRYTVAAEAVRQSFICAGGNTKAVELLEGFANKYKK